jgi:hypothetical protein
MTRNRTLNDHLDVKEIDHVVPPVDRDKMGTVEPAAGLQAGLVSLVGRVPQQEGEVMANRDQEDAPASSPLPAAKTALLLTEALAPWDLAAVPMIIPQQKDAENPELAEELPFEVAPQEAALEEVAPQEAAQDEVASILRRLHAMKIGDQRANPAKVVAPILAVEVSLTPNSVARREPDAPAEIFEVAHEVAHEGVDRSAAAHPEVVRPPEEERPVHVPLIEPVEAPRTQNADLNLSDKPIAAFISPPRHNQHQPVVADRRWSFPNPQRERGTILQAKSLAYASGYDQHQLQVFTLVVICHRGFNCYCKHQWDRKVSPLFEFNRL